MDYLFKDKHWWRALHNSNNNSNWHKRSPVCRRQNNSNFFLINDQNKQKVEREKDRGRSLDRVSNYFRKKKKEMHSFQISFLFTSAFMRNDKRIAEGRRTIVVIRRTSGENSLFTNMRRIRMIGWKLQRNFMRRHVSTVQWSRNSKWIDHRTEKARVLLGDYLQFIAATDIAQSDVCVPIGLSDRIASTDQRTREADFTHERKIQLYIRVEKRSCSSSRFRSIYLWTWSSGAPFNIRSSSNGSFHALRIKEKQTSHHND